jgi:tRNA dimethylallyltransferase
VILEKLREVDPVMADRWHPNESRKIQRSLEIYLRTGKPASQVYDEQRIKREIEQNDADSNRGESSTGLRFPTLLFWVHADKDVLYPRLDGRVDKMLARGLLNEVDELTKFRNDYEARTGTAVDQSRGIWVSIGYKEFLSYQSALTDSSLAPSELEKQKTAAIEKTQAATRQYSSRQARWIRIKLLNALFGAGYKSNMFLLDGSDLPMGERSHTPSNHDHRQFLVRPTAPRSFLSFRSCSREFDTEAQLRSEPTTRQVAEEGMRDVRDSLNH